MPTSSASRASLRLSGQLPDQRSGTSVTARPDEQFAPNSPILSLFALCIDMRSCRVGAGASTVPPEVLFDTGEWPSQASPTSRRFEGTRALEHDPEKWAPVFGKDHAPPKPVATAKRSGDNRPNKKSTSGRSNGVGLAIAHGCYARAMGGRGARRG